jgi:hypothetical protein
MLIDMLVRRVYDTVLMNLRHSIFCRCYATVDKSDGEHSTSHRSDARCMLAGQWSRAIVFFFFFFFLFF